MNGNIIIKEVKCKYLDYKTQECVFNCTDSQYIYEKEEGSLTYCLDGCSEYIGETLFLNYENKCVKTCKTDYEKQENIYNTSNASRKCRKITNVLCAT